MTEERAKKMLKAKLECLKREISGIDCDDGYNCDDCELLYAQGTAGEQKEALEMAIRALEQTRWIPTSEKLPEDYTHVLCQFALGGMCECYLAHGLFHVVGGLRLPHDEIVAWMPLPESYKMKSEG